MKRENVNIHEMERFVSILLGGTLLIQGITRRPLVGLPLATIGGALLYRGISGHSYLYQGLGVNMAEEGRQYGTRSADGTPEVERSITVERPAKELNRFWRDPDTLSRIMGNFAEVTPADDNRLHWRMRVPFGRKMEWDTQIIEDRPGEIVRWKSLNGAQLRSEGEVRFHPAPKDWGTETTLHLRFEPPGGAIGKMAVRRFHILPRLAAEKTLRRFKSLAETGEIPTLDYNPSARGMASAR